MNKTTNWIESAIVYHLYVRSFYDSNNDGIGDIPGIIKKLDYLYSLGITAIWLSPIYPSPQKDFGYDVANFCDIDPIFGTLSDFEKLLAKAHQKNIRILMDYIPNHTSSKHPWFEESRSSKDNKKRSWYIWANPKADGSTPNNWLSVFGGSAWELDRKTNQYYLHSFDKEQPDLNWRNKDVEKEMISVLRFWMDHGVDGFRVDAPYHIFKDPLLRDEPLNSNFMAATHDYFDSLLHIYTICQPEYYELMKRLVTVLKKYKNKFMVIESRTALPELIKIHTTVGWRFFQPFNFSFIKLPWRADLYKQYIDEYDKQLGNLHLPCFVLGNHDTPRVTTRIGKDQARVAAMLLITLRNIPFIYYGDEIGMENAILAKEDIHDTLELTSPGLGLGRDGQRTPMQWDTCGNAGFSSHKPWLPASQSYDKINVAVEEKDSRSMLSLYKTLINLRKTHKALKEGIYLPLPLPANNIMAYIRKNDEEKILIIANFSDKETQVSLQITNARVLCNSFLTMQKGAKLSLNKLQLKGNEGYIFLLP